MRFTEEECDRADVERDRQKDDRVQREHARRKGWIAFEDEMPAPAYDRDHPDRPTHGMILVTNNIESRNRWGRMSHVWLVAMVHPHEKQHVFNGTIRAEAGEITAFAEPGGTPLRNLSHWRPAVPEEWLEQGGDRCAFCPGEIPRDLCRPIGTFAICADCAGRAAGGARTAASSIIEIDEDGRVYGPADEIAALKAGRSTL